MSASTKASGLKINTGHSSVRSDIKKLGIFSGGGGLPRLLVDYCKHNNIEPYVVAFKSQTDPETYIGVEHIHTRIAASGSILKWLKNNDIKDVVFIGAIKRPLLRTMIPDLTTLLFFLTKGIWARGDNAILKAARVYLEKRGIKLHGIHTFLPSLLMPAGVLTKQIPEIKETDIQLGVTESQNLGVKDIGQAVLIKGGQIIGREDAKGTNALIRKYGEEGAILVKTCKPQQDKDLDLPTIGLGTVQACLDKKMAGIVAHAGNSLFLDQAAAVGLADKNKMFIKGVTI